MKEFLSDHDISFKDFNVAEDPEALDTLVATTGKRATPVIVVGDEVVSGFDRGRLQRLLRLQEGGTGG